MSRQCPAGLILSIALFSTSLAGCGPQDDASQAQAETAPDMTTPEETGEVQAQLIFCDSWSQWNSADGHTGYLRCTDPDASGVFRARVTCTSVGGVSRYVLGTCVSANDMQTSSAYCGSAYVTKIERYSCY